MDIPHGVPMAQALDEYGQRVVQEFFAALLYAAKRRPLGVRLDVSAAISHWHAEERQARGWAYIDCPLSSYHGGTAVVYGIISQRRGEWSTSQVAAVAGGTISRDNIRAALQALERRCIVRRLGPGLYETA